MNKKALWIVIISLFGVIALGMLGFVLFSGPGNEVGQEMTHDTGHKNGFLSFLDKISFKDYEQEDPKVTEAIKDDDVPVNAIGYLKTDLNVIPDKYNTGVFKGSELEKITGDDAGRLKEKYGLPFKMSTATKLVLNFHGIRDATGTITIENLDFSDLGFNVYNSDLNTKQLKLIFKNCRFSSFGMSDYNDLITYEFHNCSFTSLSGGNMDVVNCYVGGGQSDGIRAFSNTNVIGCYIADKSQPNSDKNTGNHTDGVQIYGLKDGSCQNIHFSNCRFEMPSLKNATATVNACLMLQIEFSDANDITFSDCWINGGGFSIYAWCKREEFTLYHAEFTNVHVGCLHRFGNIYSRIGKNVVFNNVGDTENAYVSSIWTENGKTHIIASNDTKDFKTIIVYTDQGEALISLDACPNNNDIPEGMSFNDFPFDVDTVLDYEAKWAVCYEYVNNEKILIRNYNPSGAILIQADDGSVVEYEKK